MNPILYSPYETVFNHNGIGVLSQCMSCLCTEVLNGSYEITLTYPVSGVFQNEIQLNSVIKVKPNYRDNPQPFRVYRIIKDIDGYITVKAAHLCYDTSGIPVMPFMAASLQDAIVNINERRNLENESEFVITANYSIAGDMTVEVPTSLRALMGGSENTLNYIYGGEYHYDGFVTELLQRRGRDVGASIRYGKNILDFEQESDCEELYTAVFGYWYRSATNDNPAESVYGNIIHCSGNYPYEKVMTLDVSDKFNSDYTPSKSEIDDVVRQYIADNGIGVPKYEMKIDYTEDSGISGICLGDTLGVYFPVYDIKAAARCTTVVFDCLKERNDSIKVGVVGSNISSTIASITADNSELRRQMVNEARGIKTDFKSTTTEIRGSISDLRGNLTEVIADINGLRTTITSVQTAQSNTNTRLDTAESTLQTFRTVVIPDEFAALINDYVSAENSPNNVNANRIKIIESFIKLMGGRVLSDGTIINGGVVLGQNISEIKLKLENDVLYFFKGSEDTATKDSALAYFAAGKMWINTALIEVLMIGTEEDNFIFKLAGSGNNRCLFISGKVSTGGS